MAMACYARPEGDVTIFLDNFTPCYDYTDDSNYLSCCGLGDICGQYGFCFSASSASEVNKSGYYLGGCTDREFADEAACPHHCYLTEQDVVWDADDGNWHCCAQKQSDNSTVVDCRDPYVAGFITTPPTSVFANRSRTLPSTSSAPAAASSTFTDSSDATNFATRQRPDNITKYVASIVPVVVLAIILAVLLLCWRRRKAKRKIHVQQPYGPQRNDMEAAKTWKPANGTLLFRDEAELDSRSPMPELSSTREGGELDSKEVGAKERKKWKLRASLSVPKKWSKDDQSER